MKFKNLANLLLGSSILFSGCKLTEKEYRMQMFEQGKYLEQWPWINDNNELKNNLLSQVDNNLQHNQQKIQHKESTLEKEYEISSKKISHTISDKNIPNLGKLFRRNEDVDNK